MEKRDKLNQYMKEFKEFDLDRKKDIIVEQLKVLAITTNEMCKSVNSNNELLLHKELFDIKQDNYTDDDFLEALIVLISSTQNSLTDFNNTLVDQLENIFHQEDTSNKHLTN